MRIKQIGISDVYLPPEGLCWSKPHGASLF